MIDTLSKADIKRIRSLRLKKNRDEMGWFLAEGEKLIRQFILCGMKAVLIVGTEEHPDFTALKQTDSKTFKDLSQLDHPSGLLALFQKPNFQKLEHPQRVEFYFEDIQDPGNFGTILRTASWFGLQKIYCSPFSVDRFNSKVVQSSMGSIALVDVEEISVEGILSRWKSEKRKVFTADMQGIPYKSIDSNSNQIGVILGNEGKGISAALRKEIEYSIQIPAHENSKMESLNVSIAASILMSHFY
jgi:RNA methyltransferase, TrmH family